jgi:hypothetical protein
MGVGSFEDNGELFFDISILTDINCKPGVS